MDLLRWQEEGQQALISDPSEPVFVETPMPPPMRSLSRRSGIFHLDPEGALEGDVRIEVSGHTAASVRSDREDKSLAQQEEALRDDFRSRMGTAEVTAIAFENAGDVARPLVTTCHIKVPDYAQRVGKRLLVSPAFFKHGLVPMFSSGDRRHPIYFHYPWAEQDSVQIRIPDGFTLDAADSPAPIRAEGVSEYHATVGITADGATLHYWREFQFGESGMLSFPANAYKSLKGYFDLIAERDAHTLTLKAME
jgi:hypothetical protein